MIVTFFFLKIVNVKTCDITMQTFRHCPAFLILKSFPVYKYGTCVSCIVLYLIFVKKKIKVSRLFD